MGFFTNSKKGCPICGEPTPRLFPTKVEDTPICKTCAKKIALPDGMLERMNLNAFGAYIQFHDDNASLRDAFNEEYCYDVDGWNDEIQIDLSQKLFRISDKDNAIVFEGSCIQSFQILEDGQPLLEGDRSGLKAYPSEVPDRARQLQAMVDAYNQEKRNYERMKRMVDMMSDDDERKEEKLRDLRRYEPRFEPTMPMEQFQILLNMDHPYWPTFEGKLDGPSFGYEPSVLDYIQSYQDKANALAELAKNLMQLFAPHARVQKAGAQAAAPAAPAAPSGDAIAQIKSYKELLDLGIITEEEFAAKKRELLGL